MIPAIQFRQSNKFLSVKVFLLSLALMLGLTGCGGSGGDSEPGPLPDQVASGLYKDGTAELDGGVLMLNDLRGFVHDGRVIMFSIQGHLLIDGQITSLTSDDFEATMDVYEDGVKTQPGVSVTGNVLTESKITGNISGTGKASGDFTLTFDPLYSRGATFARVDTNLPSSSFMGDINSTMVGSTTDNFNFGQVNVYDMLATAPFPGFVRCGSDGSYTIPDSNINIFMLNETIRKPDPECTMSITPDYTGFAAAIDGTSVDDTLVYAVSNGENAQFAILTK